MLTYCNRSSASPCPLLAISLLSASTAAKHLRRTSVSGFRFATDGSVIRGSRGLSVKPPRISEYPVATDRDGRYKIRAIGYLRKVEIRGNPVGRARRHLPADLLDKQRRRILSVALTVQSSAARICKDSTALLALRRRKQRGAINATQIPNWLTGDPRRSRAKCQEPYARRNKPLASRPLHYSTADRIIHGRSNGDTAGNLIRAGPLGFLGIYRRSSR